MTYAQQQTAVTYIDWDFVSWITEDYREKTAQISCNTVTQYCSVFCLTAVIVSYCGCGWFRFNLQRRSLAGRVARFWCGMSLSPLQHASICIPEKQAQMQVSQNREDYSSVSAMKLHATLIQRILQFHLWTWTLDQVSIQRATISKAILWRC